MVYDNILGAACDTPLVRLNRLTGPDDAAVLVKVECVNVGGSIKTRTALRMVEEAERRGDITPDTVIIEPTSGNQGIGLALVCAVKGYRAIIVMPSSVSAERRQLVKQYGAQVELIEDCGDIGACIEACLRRAEALAKTFGKAYIPQQFINPDNPQVHRDQTGQEILRQAEGPIDGFCAGIGTGGCITGIGEALRARYPGMTIWALEPENAAILTGGPIGTHLQMGIGDGLIPENLNTALYDDVVVVPDSEALRTAKALAREEGLLCGISSGANVWVALKMARALGRGKTVVTLLPDTGERYFSTPLFG